MIPKTAKIIPNMARPPKTPKKNAPTEIMINGEKVERHLNQATLMFKILKMKLQTNSDGDKDQAGISPLP